MTRHPGLCSAVAPENQPVRATPVERQNHPVQGHKSADLADGPNVQEPHPVRALRLVSGPNFCTNLPRNRNFGI